MITRAGSVGLITGLLISILVYPLLIFTPDAFLLGRLNGPGTAGVWIAAFLVGLFLFFGGGLASRWSGSTQPGRCAVLGAAAGGLAGMVVFCLWGAALAGLARWASQQNLVNLVLRQTMEIFLFFIIDGIGLGALGGWLTCPRSTGIGQGQTDQQDVFNKSDPQMAMNVSITALPASMFAAALAAYVFSRLANSMGDITIVNLPLAVSLLLVLISHLTLTLVILHETKQAEHRSGMDEVKMAAFVGMGAAPVLILLLFLVDASSFTNPLVLVTLLTCTAMSLKSLHSLFTLVLPRRASFPSLQSGSQKREAQLFGSIANSRGPRLVTLCIGCGLMMVLPAYVTVISVLINLNSLSGSVSTQVAPEIKWKLFLTQALTSTGLCAAAIIVLIVIYIFYLNLGRWFSKRNGKHAN